MFAQMDDSGTKRSLKAWIVLTVRKNVSDEVPNSREK
jgi:hypothetical protein